jgi:hypothetical protein
MVKLQTYEQFGPRQLTLPPHGPDDVKNKIRYPSMIVSLKSLMQLDHNDVVSVGNRVNDLCIEQGSYLTVRHNPTGMMLITHNEPANIFGVQKGKKVSIGNHRSVEISDDSIIVHVKADDTLYVFSTKDDYEFIFIKPKIVVSSHDPYGEEDWDEH